MKKNLLRDSVITGLALFAMFFGAGNLIFPPKIGLVSGEAWFLGALGLLLSAIILPVTAVWSVNNAGGDARKLLHHIHPNAYTIANAVGWIFCGIGSTLPRVAAVTHELGVQALFPDIPIWVTVIVFFALLYFFAKDKDSVVDKIGKYLTPVLLILLAIVLIKGVISPVGAPGKQVVENAFTYALFQGYVIGDLTLGLMSANIFVYAMRSKGYARNDEKKGIILAGMICVIVMFALYGTMAYIGATGASHFSADTEQAPLLVGLVNLILGGAGKACLGIVVALACLTTGVAVATTIASFFSELTKNKLKYRVLLLCMCIVCGLFSVSGVTNIINYVTPIFLSIYPPFIVATFLGLFDKVIPNDGIYKGGVLTALVFGIFDGILFIFPRFTALSGVLVYIPLFSAGFGWVVPSIIAMIIGYFAYKGKARTYYNDTSASEAEQKETVVSEEQVITNEIINKGGIK